MTGNTRAQHDAELRAVVRWLAERGLGVEFTADAALCERFFWAALTSLPSGRVIAPSYGRGSCRASAARSAQERFTTEHQPEQRPA